MKIAVGSKRGVRVCLEMEHAYMGIEDRD